MEQLQSKWTVKSYLKQGQNKASQAFHIISFILLSDATS